LYENLTVFNRGEWSNVYGQESGNGNFSDLANFISVLNLSSNQTFPQEITQVFDVDRYLRALAVEIYLINTDSYHRNGNNWCLYKNPATGLFEVKKFNLRKNSYFQFFGHDFDFSMRPVSGVVGIFAFFMFPIK
jgi:spore coat protein CotH